MEIKNYYLDKLGDDFSKLQKAESVKNPKLLVFNDDLAREIGFEKLLKKTDEKAQILCGNKLIDGSKPIAMAYAGHQFGHFSPQLGDGRAVLLGEIEHESGLIDIVLKGSGRTYFSRGGDGKCPLFAAVKEYIFSEFLHYLGVKTTRALSIVKGDEFALRQYGPEPSAVITRIAQSHIRIGTFQYFAAQGDLPNVKKLADYAINRHYEGCEKFEDQYFEFFKQVAKRQIDLIASWMSFGFIHGVMNTDNILICGQTVDFGPCAFMEKFNPGKVFSSIDRNGRYAFDQQKAIILWNLTRLAESILPLVCDGNTEKAVNLIEGELAKLSEDFDDIYYRKMAKKIGITNFKKNDQDFVDDFLDILEEKGLDFTNSFRSLSGFLNGDDFIVDSKNLSDDSEFNEWSLGLKKRLGLVKGEGGSKKINEIIKSMNLCNPSFVPRNYRVIEVANQVVNGDTDEFKKLSDLIKKPFADEIDEGYCRVASEGEEEDFRTFCGT